ncbi:MAG: hypothetical protein ACLFWH_15160 [Actinomycetota bacterium]
MSEDHLTFAATQIGKGNWEPSIPVEFRLPDGTEGMVSRTMNSLIDTGAAFTKIPCALLPGGMPQWETLETPPYDPDDWGDFEPYRVLHPVQVHFAGVLFAKAVLVRPPSDPRQSYAVLGRMDFLRSFSMTVEFHKEPPQFTLTPQLREPRIPNLSQRPRR